MGRTTNNKSKSTDFEVHRNWLAITHSLPLKNWYTDTTSQWTLDYPPLFAWFEWALSQVAVYFDPAIVNVYNLNYDSQRTILFQRLSVIFTDLIFALGCKVCIQEVQKRTLYSVRTTECQLLFAIIFGNCGLLFVDHIHFQYNGFLFGIFFLSIGRMLQGKELESAFWFSLLLNLKHIYLYLAPAYFVYLLRSVCLSSDKDGRIRGINFIKTIKLAGIVIGIFGISFGPFLMIGQGPQLLSRLFPFKRGLSHAYWAPNFWALYNFLDKILTVGGVKFGFVKKSVGSHMTGGLVQDVEHIVLPTVTPLATFILTLVTMLPCLIKVWRNPSNRLFFLRSIIYCTFCSFLFGWHVHEKAILMVILPMSLLILFGGSDAKTLLLLSIVGHFSLFPLIFTAKETVFKVLSLLLHASLTYTLVAESSRKQRHFRLPLLNCIEKVYIFGLLVVFVFGEVFQYFNNTLPFLPLMITSVYTGLGVVYAWTRFCSTLFCSPLREKLKKKS